MVIDLSSQLGVLAPIAIPAAIVIGRNIIGFWNALKDSKDASGNPLPLNWKIEHFLLSVGRIGLFAGLIFVGAQVDPTISQYVDPSVATAIGTLVDIARNKGK